MSTKKTLVDLLAEVMAEVGYVQKDKRNDFSNYDYASAEAVLKKVNAALSSRGICVETDVELLLFETNDDGKTNAVVKTTANFRYGEEAVTAAGIGQGRDGGDKAVMKANTASLKYLVANAFMISWGDDPEADTRTDREASVPVKKKARKRKNPPSAKAETIDLFAERLKRATSLEELEETAKLIKKEAKLSFEQKGALTLVYNTKKKELENNDAA